MTSHCDKVELFVDGELPAEEADAFRLHLPDCTNCQRAMDRLMQLYFVGASHVQESARQEVSAPARSPVRSRWGGFSRVAALFRFERRPLFIAAAAFAAVLLVLVVRQPFKPSLESDVWLAQRPERLLEARVSYPGADRYRPPAAKMMGGAGSAEELPYGDLAMLQQGDQHGLAAAFLVRGEKGLAGRALQQLEKLGHSPELDSDRAVAKLLSGQREEALRLLDAALAENPRHPQALWNRGLVLRELGLPLLAAAAFSEVAALKEPGWSEEAARKAEALLSDARARRERWDAVNKAGEGLRDAPPGNLPQGFSEISNARRHFYEAVRVAPSRERVLLLLPIAQDLDKRAGGQVLESYVRRIAEADFSRRAPLSQRYLDLLKSRLSPQERDQLLAALLASKEDDISLGAIAFTDTAARYLESYEQKAAASGDPWFQLLAAYERARMEATQGKSRLAIQGLLDAKKLCAGRGLEYRCLDLAVYLSDLYSRDYQRDRARSEAEEGWEKSHEVGEWMMESRLLWMLGQIARLSGDTSLARAYFGEFLARGKDDPDTARRVHQDLAVMAMRELRVDEARREIDAALATGIPLGLPGVVALAEISRLKPASGDEENLIHAVEKVVTPRMTPGERLIPKHVLGRFYIEKAKDAEKGRGLLWRVIEEAEAPGLAGERGARRARAYSFTSLILAAGRLGDFQEALKLVERERGLELPRRCLLVATVDSERTLFMARGDDGRLVGHYDDTRRQPLPRQLDRVVPEALLTPLRPCERVDVLARPPLHGRVGLLPPELAWSYLTRTSAPRAAPVGPPVHLVVSDVELPPEAGLERLNSWTPSFGPGEQPMTLSGTRATPSQVLSAMKDATEIDLVTHGILNDYGDSSYLMLAPGPEGPELRVQRVREASLQGAPFVVLAACYAGHATFSVDDPLSIPDAFIQAGARGVLAATVPIPDLEAQAFFNAVRERMRAGTVPAIALRDERMRWLSEGKGVSWIESVLLFE